MLKSTQSQEGEPLVSTQSQEPLAICSKAASKMPEKHPKSRGEAVCKMLESTQSQEGESLASCPKAHKVKRGSRLQDARKPQSQEGEPLARCSKAHKVKKGNLSKMLEST